LLNRDIFFFVLYYSCDFYWLALCIFGLEAITQFL